MVFELDQINKDILDNININIVKQISYVVKKEKQPKEEITEDSKEQ